MSALCNTDSENARKTVCNILQSMQSVGGAAIATALETSEATVSRLKDGQAKIGLEEFSILLAVCNLELVPTNRNSAALVVDRREFESLQVLAKRYLDGVVK